MVETIILEDYTPNRQLINAATKLGNVKRGQKFTRNIHKYHIHKILKLLVTYIFYGYTPFTGGMRWLLD